MNVDFLNFTNQRNRVRNGDTLMDNQRLTVEMPFDISGCTPLRF